MSEGGPRGPQRCFSSGRVRARSRKFDPVRLYQRGPERGNGFWWCIGPAVENGQQVVGDAPLRREVQSAR